ncbi:hypothetical protein ACWF94_21010 [Streptomyces sp. NPDC055078]
MVSGASVACPVCRTGPGPWPAWLDGRIAFEDDASWLSPGVARCATPNHPWLYWLVPPGTSSWWEPHPYAVCVGAPHTIMLPPLGRRGPDGGGSYWLRPWQQTVLVRPVTLRQALLDIHRSGPSPHAAMTMPVLGTAS